MHIIIPIKILLMTYMTKFKTDTIKSQHILLKAMH